MALFFKKNPSLSLFLTAAAGIIFILIVFETGLRIAGYQPGDISPGWRNFTLVDSLIIYDDFIVGDDAIMVANQQHFQMQDISINSDGFRCKEFNDHQTKQKKPSLMLIGDSFVWGFSAQPVDSCFADQLRELWQGRVYNMGIPAADPVQYALIAEKWIPKLKPDVVCLVFFMGNDIVFTDRQPEPEQRYYYWTNAGAILTEFDGEIFPDAHSAYKHLISRRYYLTEPEGFLETVASYCALLSRLYAVKYRAEEKLRYENQLNDFSLTLKYLHKAYSAAVAGGAEFHLIVIPEVKEADMAVEKYMSRYSKLFNNEILAPIISMPATDKSWFNDYPDAHLNNTGHTIYARYIYDIITKKRKEAVVTQQ